MRFQLSTCFSIIFSLSMLMLTGCSGGDDNTPPATVLTILHTNDIHSAYGGLTESGRICYDTLCENGTGGALRLKQAVEAIRQDRGERTILLDAGNRFQGTLFYTQYQEKPTIDLLNALNYDAITVGSHEFDGGCEPILNLAASVTDTPMLAANLTLKNLRGQSVNQPWTVIERSGVRIGIIGIANPETDTVSVSCRDAVFSEAMPALLNALNELKKERVQTVIALISDRLAAVKNLAEKIDGVDLYVVGDHQHLTLSDAPDADGPYPIEVKTPNGQRALLVATNAYSQTLGRLDIDVDQNGRIVRWEKQPILLDGRSSENLPYVLPEIDSALQDTLKIYTDGLRDMVEKAVGIIETDQPSGQGIDQPDMTICRSKECLSGNIVADAMRASVSGAHIALVNNGNIFASLPSGRVTFGDVIQSIPFENQVLVGDVPGSVLLNALQHGMNRYEEGFGAFLQVSGIQYTIDPSQPVGDRVRSAQLMEGEWTAINPMGYYRVVVTDYLANGGDGFTMLKDIEWTDTKKTQSSVLSEYLSRQSPLKPALENRIQVISASQ